MGLRRSVFNSLQPSNRKDPGHYIDLFIICLIVLSILEIILESEKSLKIKYGSYFNIFEIFSVAVFSIEYFLRIWSCIENKKFRHPIWGRLRFMSTGMAIVDLLAILPFYLPFIGFDLRFLRVLRLFRIFRILKMARYTNALILIKNVLKEKKEELLVTVGFMVVVLLIISTLMYYVERDIQPENFSSIPKALWWGVITLTTVGYGDIYPVSGIGRILAGFITLIGIGLIALPSGILASGYTEQILLKKQKKLEDKKEIP